MPHSFSASFFCSASICLALRVPGGGVVEGGSLAGKVSSTASSTLASRSAWADFSSWLLAVGMAGGVVAAIAGLVSWLAHRRDRAQRPVWTVMLGSLLVLVIAFIINLVHSRDAWTSVMPGRPAPPV